MSTDQDLLRTKTKQLPRKPGIYLFKNRQGDVIYIGKARSLQERVKSYFLASKDPKAQQLIKEIAYFEFILTDSAREASFLENNFIRRYQPKFNLRLKDDKHFPFIKITIRDAFPSVCLVRRVEEDGAKYIGPFSPSFEARKTITLLSKFFGIRTCQEKIQGNRKRACLEFDLGLCSAPCVDRINSEDYRKNMQNALLFLQGHVEDVIKNIQVQMKKAAGDQDFEQAAHLRDLIRTLKHIKNRPKLISVGRENIDIFGFAREKDDVALCVFIMRQGEVVHSEKFVLHLSVQKSDHSILASQIQSFYKKRSNTPDGILLPFSPLKLKGLKTEISKLAGKKVDILVPKKGGNKKLIEFANTNAESMLKKTRLETVSLKEIQDIFALSHIPYRIEGFDISNTGGDESVGSLVLFKNGRPKKSEYRRYRIRSVTGPDDTASLYEVITRRYSRLLEEGMEYPDLIIVDGGKGQWNAARKALKNLGLDHFPVIAIAKREEILFSTNNKQGLILEKTSPALKLIQHVRDETHRFAISLHRKRRENKSFMSFLDDIPGIGPKRKNFLLSRYSNIKAIRNAPPSEIEKIVGKKAAASLNKHLPKFVD